MRATTRFGLALLVVCLGSSALAGAQPAPEPATALAEVVVTVVCWTSVRRARGASYPRFRAIAAQVREYVAKQHAAVDDLRRRGEIPRRIGTQR